MLQKRNVDKAPYFTTANFPSGKKLFVITDIKVMPDMTTLDKKRGQLFKMWIKDDSETIFHIGYLSENFDLQDLVHGYGENELDWIGKQVLISVIPAANPKYLNWQIVPAMK